MCVFEVIRSKDDTKQKIKEFYTSKQLYGVYLINYDFIWKTLFLEYPI